MTIRRCTTCGYDLRAHPAESRCPECGRPAPRRRDPLDHDEIGACRRMLEEQRRHLPLLFVPLALAVSLLVLWVRGDAPGWTTTISAFLVLYGAASIGANRLAHHAYRERLSELEEQAARTET